MTANKTPSLLHKWPERRFGLLSIVYILGTLSLNVKGLLMYKDFEIELLSSNRNLSELH